jgi:hypothetical protein
VALSAIPKELVLELPLVRVTTRIVLREKKAGRSIAVIVKTTRRAIADAVVLNWESFTKCSRAHFDDNSSHRTALVFVEVLLRNS